MASTAFLQRAYLAYFGRPVDPSGLAAYGPTTNVSEAAVLAAFSASPESQALIGSTFGVTQVNNIYQTLFGRDAEPAGLTYWTTEVGAGRITAAGAAVAILQGAQNADLTAVNNKLAASAAFSAALTTTEQVLGYVGTAAATSARTFLTGITSTAATATAVTNAVTSVVTAGSSGAGASFALTAGLDNIIGTSSNNSIDASRVILSGVAYNSLGNSDSVDGGAGTDTLIVQMQEATDITPGSLKSVEIVTLEVMSNNAANDRTLSLSNADTAVTTLSMDNGAGTAGQLTTVANVQSALTTINVTNTLRDHTVTVANARLTGTADTLALNLSGTTGGAGQTISVGTVTAASGYETINVKSSGSLTNTITLNDGAATSLATVNVTGDRALTVVLVPTTVTKVDASAFTAALTLTAATGNAVAMSVTGGTGNDVINIGQTAGDYTTADTIAGGAGTDRLTLINADATNATATQSNVSGIEIIGLADGISGAVSLTNFGATGLRFEANTAANSTIAYTAGTGSLDLQTFTLGHTITATAAGVATTDVMNLTIGSTAAGNNSGSTMTFTGFERVNILSQGAANTITALSLTNTATTESIVITGDQTLTLATSIVADSIDASGMTASAALVMGANANTLSMTITGTGNADTLFGGTAADIISGGAGADLISNVAAGTTGSTGDVLTGGAGFDTFILRGDVASGALSTIMSTAARVTDFTVGSTATTTDILTLSATSTNYSSAGTQNAAGIASAAAGSTAIQTVAVNAAATAYVTGTDLIKLTTGVATTGLTLQQAFNAAIGTATVTATGTNRDQVFFSLYDTTNSRMVVGIVDAGAGNQVVASADVVTLVGTIDMSSADYSTFSAANLAVITS